MIIEIYDDKMIADLLNTTNYCIMLLNDSLQVEN